MSDPGNYMIWIIRLFTPYKCVYVRSLCIQLGKMKAKTEWKKTTTFQISDI